VVCNPETYKTCGHPAMLTNNEHLFMIDLVWNKPGLFLSKICERLYDSSGTLLSVEAVHQNLFNFFSITLKKAGTNNIQKSLVAKFAFVDKMKFYPAHWLVFTGKQILLFFIITIHYMILQDHPSCSDETSICDCDLLQMFAVSLLLCKRQANIVTKVTKDRTRYR
jgi:hypothetical protein